MLAPPLYVRAHDVKILVGKALFPEPEPRLTMGVSLSDWRAAHDAWGLQRADWEALRDAVLAECRRQPFLAETVFRAFLKIPAFADEEEETAWRAAQKDARAAAAKSARLLRARELKKTRAARLRKAKSAARRCTCQHCPVHRGWAAVYKRRLRQAAGD